MSDPCGIDLQRLRVYVAERVKESKRLSEAHVPEAVAHAHLYSERVGRQILQEIDDALAVRG